MSDLAIELSRDPEIHLVYSSQFQCPLCLRRVAVRIQALTEKDWHCVSCMIARGGKDAVVIAGWVLSRSALDQVTARRMNGKDK